LTIAHRDPEQTRYCGSPVKCKCSNVCEGGTLLSDTDKFNLDVQRFAGTGSNASATVCRFRRTAEFALVAEFLVAMRPSGVTRPPQANG
jgi:hypothetical protein